MNIYTEGQYGLYEDNEVACLDPLLDLLRVPEFNDYFWHTEYQETDLPSTDASS